MTGKIEDFIMHLSAPGNPKSLSERAHPVHFIKRESREIIDTWKKTLTKEEVARIREKVQDVSKDYYATDEW